MHGGRPDCAPLARASPPSAALCTMPLGAMPSKVSVITDRTHFVVWHDRSNRIRKNGCGNEVRLRNYRARECPLPRRPVPPQHLGGGVGGAGLEEGLQLALEEEGVAGANNPNAQ